MTGYFITYEGPDGAGKTSVIGEVVKILQEKCNRKIIVTREPGGSKIAEKIRNIILDPENTEMNSKTEALLYAASRSQHVSEVIKPALKRGEIVISDRFVDSSLAYQGQGRGLGIEEIESINNFATENLQPDLTIFLDVKPEVGLARIRKERGGTEDRLEKEKIDFHKQVYEGYQRVNKLYPERIKIIDASDELSQVVENSVKIIESRFPEIFN